MLLPRAAATGCLLALALVTLLSLLTPTDALIIRIPSGQEYCFFEEASKADKIVGNYKVLEGGELDIDLRITDPKGRMIFETTKKREESFQFFALQDGEYTLCLSNKFSMILGKTVVFNLHLGASLAKKVGWRKASRLSCLHSCSSLQLDCC
jgi:hypothetical protein